jgi:hypothetical protein
MVKLRKSCLFIILISFIESMSLFSQDASGLKVVSSKNPDMSSVETIIASVIKPEMKPQEKAEVFFDFLVQRTFHHNTAEEPLADMLMNRKYQGENSMLEDAIKMINVYGFGLCGSHSKYQTEFYNAMGMLGRICGGNGHTIPEVKYDNGWHYFDIDMMGYCKDKDGKISSVAEISKDKSLMTNNFAKYKHKFDGPNNMYGALANRSEGSFYGRKMGIHSMNLGLRKGEKITRYFKRQWAPDFHYYCPPESVTGSDYGKRLRQNVKNNTPGPNRDKTHYLFMEQGAARFGNFDLTYEPSLEDADFVSDLYAKSNIKQNKKAPFIGPDKDSEGSEIVLNYYSPYGCAGSAGDLKSNDDDKDGFVLEGEFANDSGEISYSFDLGKSWVSAHNKGGAFKLDLTPAFVCKYGWLVKVAFKGKDAGLKSFKSRVTGQLSPASLPFVDGATDMNYTSDNTACALYAPDVTISEEELKRTTHSLDTYLSWSDNISQHVNFGADNNGGIIMKVEVPNDLVFVKAGANFNARKTTTRNGVAFSIDDGATWITACEQGIISNEDFNEDFWGQGVEGVLDLRTGKAYSPGCGPVEGNIRETKFDPKPVKSVLVKFYTKGGNGKLVKVAGIYAHYKKEQKNAVKITHEWEGGKHEEKIPAGEKTHPYKVAGGKIESNLSVTIEVPAK